LIADLGCPGLHKFKFFRNCTHYPDPIGTGFKEKMYRTPLIPLVKETNEDD